MPIWNGHPMASARAAPGFWRVPPYPIHPVGRRAWSSMCVQSVQGGRLLTALSPGAGLPRSSLQRSRKGLCSDRRAFQFGGIERPYRRPEILLPQELQGQLKKIEDNRRFHRSKQNRLESTETDCLQTIFPERMQALHSAMPAHSSRSRSTTVRFSAARTVRTGMPAPSRAKRGTISRKTVRSSR